MEDVVVYGTRNVLEAARLAGLAGEIPEKIELALGAAVIKEFLSG